MEKTTSSSGMPKMGLTMNDEVNQMNQPIGIAVDGWSPPPAPSWDEMEGRFCRLEPLRAERHAKELMAAYALDKSGKNWTYLPYGPFRGLDDYRSWIERDCRGTDPLFYAVVDLPSGKAVGVVSFLRIKPDSGSIEVGHLSYSPLLQRKPAATEAMYLMMERAFDLGYRRYEWKCHSLNAPSRAAAQRLGLSFEGIFRQATVVKGRSRDTAWYAAIDQEWPAISAAIKKWLNPENFDTEGKQRSRLSHLTAPILKKIG